MYKVFVNKSPIVLTDKTEMTLKSNGMIIPFVNGKQLRELVVDLENNKPKKRVYITHFDLDELWAAFVNEFNYVQAAGGLVFNEKNEFLVIHRNGKWDLPKGHLKKGERPEYGAMREVEEECGIGNLSITKPLSNTFHMYERNGLVLKKTFWYVMKSNYSGDLTPQLEEGIDKVEWKLKADIPILRKKSYPIINALLKKGVKN
jgi:8-oxo-dGTP pyrophosphatase MutT (NUDIX family)